MKFARILVIAGVVLFIGGLATGVFVLVILGLIVVAASIIPA